MLPTVKKSKNLFWKHLLPIVKFLFLRNSYVCPIRIFIFDADQAQIYIMYGCRDMMAAQSETICCIKFEKTSLLLRSILPGRKASQIVIE
jgi:hypothetical protein